MRFASIRWSQNRLVWVRMICPRFLAPQIFLMQWWGNDNSTLNTKTVCRDFRFICFCSNQSNHCMCLCSVRDQISFCVNILVWRSRLAATPQFIEMAGNATTHWNDGHTRAGRAYRPADSNILATDTRIPKGVLSVLDRRLSKLFRLSFMELLY